MESTRLLLCCDNRVGILRDTTQMLASLGYSIGASCSEEGVFTNKFFFRAEFVPTENSKNSREDLEAAMQNLSRKMLNPYYRISYPNQKKRVSILTGKTTHCLDELLRLRDSLNFDLVNVIGNSSNRENKLTCARYDVPFTYVPSNATERKENEMLEYIKGSDFLITARYMLKFSKEFIESYGKAIINIHHGRIPGTEGQSNPYKNAFERQALSVGATAHFMTEELDQGPIICDSDRTVNDRTTQKSYEITGQSAERDALIEAVKLYVADKIDHKMMDGRRVIFLNKS